MPMEERPVERETVVASATSSKKSTIDAQEKRFPTLADSAGAYSAATRRETRSFARRCWFCFYRICVRVVMGFKAYRRRKRKTGT